MDLEKTGLSRREFLGAAALGTAVMATSGSVFKVLGKEEKMSGMPKIFVCSVCGHVEFGGAPDKCPICHADKNKFIMNNSLFTDAMAKLPDGATKHAPVVTVKKEFSFLPELLGREVNVRVGKTIHPMEEAHHIKFIDWYIDDKFVNRYFLSLQLYPAASLYIKTSGNKVRAVEWCNLHGYWQAEAELG